MRGWSSEPGCSCDQEQPCSEDDGSDASRYALTSRCKTFEGDGCRHDPHGRRSMTPMTRRIAVRLVRARGRGAGRGENRETSAC
jgi:hypothetical protein